MVDHETKYKLLLIGIILFLVALIVINNKNNDSVKMFDVYISKSAKPNREAISTLRKELESVNVVEYTGGQYSDAPLKSCDVVLILLNDKDQEIIGRGQYSEFKTAHSEGKKVYIVCIDKEMILLKFSNEDDINRTGQGHSWKEYAKIDSTDPVNEFNIDAIVDEGEGALVDFLRYIL